MSKLENIISESINEAVKETIAEMDIESIVKECVSEREIFQRPTKYEPFKDEAEIDRVLEYSNEIFDIFVNRGATVREMRLALNAVHDLIDECAKAVPITP